MYGPKWSFLLMYMSFDVDVGMGGSWVELPEQRRLCPIFMNSVGLPDIHEYSVGLSTDPRVLRCHKFNKHMAIIRIINFEA